MVSRLINTCRLLGIDYCFYFQQWCTQEFCSGGEGVKLVRGVSTNSVEGREDGDLGAVPPPLVRGSGGSSNLVQEISFRIVKFS
jgi:hypothetical protein